MITVKPATKPIKSNQKFGLALAGGGPLGGFYELGALCAIEDCITPLKLTDLDVYVGVSAGAFIAAGLANGIGSRELAKIFSFDKKTETTFNPDHFLQPAYRDYMENLLKTPALISKILLSWAKNPLNTSVVDLLEQTGKVLPAGVFNNKKLEIFLNKIYSSKGKTNDFRKLDKQLYIVACELNSGKIAGFSNDSNNKVPISKAVQASSALPGLYSPVKIDDKFYVDGALRRTMNASAALKRDVHLLFAINPIVPFKRAPELNNHKGVIEGGLPLVLSQTFRSIVQSRLKTGLEKYDSMFPKADIILIEPDQNDEMMFNTNLFSYAQRSNICEYAYQQTRKQIKAKKTSINQVLQRHGFSITDYHLNDPNRTIESFIHKQTQKSNSINSLNHSLNELDRIIKSM